MKNLLLVLAVLTLFAQDTLACGGGGCHGGFYAQPIGRGAGPVGGFSSAGRPYYYNGVGRFPKAVFATPLRPWGGVTPVRQFLFGRGSIRRVNRRAFLFG